MKRLSVLLVVVLAFGAFLHADVYIKTKIHADATSIMGQSQPAKDSVMEQWLAEDMVATNAENQSIILDLKANKIFIVNHAEKNYVETDLPLDMAKLLPPQAAQMMGGMMKATVTVAPNGQTKQVGSWKCSGYDVTISMMMMPMKQSLWAASDVGFDLNKFMAKAYGNIIKAQNMFFDDAAVSEMQKIKGIPILTETTMEIMGTQSHRSSEVVEIGKKTPPPGVYAVPAGYTKTDMLSMKDMQKR
ncbi:MAG: DUF4412 domain-containing protein [Candidatus Aminicenantales bacterium]